ncbi:MAG TPA: hypothetical protein VHO25_04925 [Polyangiaceae bacterium]|nr:hypothetical protein [Polyangiaceae bacterium]
MKKTISLFLTAVLAATLWAQSVPSPTVQTHKVVKEPASPATGGILQWVNIPGVLTNWSMIPKATSGYLLQAGGTTNAFVAPDAALITSGTFALARIPSSAKARGIVGGFYDGGEVLHSGMTKTTHVEVGFTITSANVQVSPSGSIVLDVLVGGVSIVASDPPTISGGTSVRDTSIGTWTATIPNNSLVTVSVTSATTVTNADFHFPGE